METIMPSQLEQASITSEWCRPPLSAVTNSPPQTPTPPQRKRVRRKSSLICRVNSSEDLLSSHDSIFHAERVSNSNSESNENDLLCRTTLNPTIQPITSMSLMGNNDNVRNQLLTSPIGSTPILYGHGTALSTIIEQKSSATMSTKKSSVPPESTSNASIGKTSISNILGHRNSFDLPSTVTLRPPRRRRSFSADDLYFIKRSYHDACAVIEVENNSSFQVYDIYAEPCTPIIPPIERPPTPPGLPSWTAAQNRPAPTLIPQRNGLIEGTRNNFQHFLSIWPSQTQVLSHCPTPIALQNFNHSTPTTLPLGTPPRFRPIRSGHGMGPLESHPFHRTNRADAKSDVAPAIPLTLTPSCPLLPSQRVIKTKSRTRTRYRHFPLVTGRAQITTSATSRSHTMRREHEARCLHRQRRLISLRTAATVPDARQQVAAFVHPASNRPQENVIQQLATLTVPTSEPQCRISTEAMSSLVPTPISAGAVTSQTPLTTIPILENATRGQKCWKCYAEKILRAIDSFWEEATVFLCGLFCCLDVDRM